MFELKKSKLRMHVSKYKNSKFSVKTLKKQIIENIFDTTANHAK